jgi:hypothetical protein
LSIVKIFEFHHLPHRRGGMADDEVTDDEHESFLIFSQVCLAVHYSFLPALIDPIDLLVSILERCSVNGHMIAVPASLHALVIGSLVRLTLQNH